jgi:CRP-like cAMP-binding protein
MDCTHSDISSILRIPPSFRSPQHIDSLVKLTSDVDFFKKIGQEQKSSDVHKECCKVMTLEEYSDGDYIFKFGEKGDKFYIILSGSVSVKVPTKKKLTVSKTTAQKIETLLESSSESDDNDSVLESDVRKINRHVTVNVAEIISAINPLSTLRSDEGDNKKIILDNEEKRLLNAFRGKVRKEQRILMGIIKRSELNEIEIEVEDLNEVKVLYAGSSFGELALLSERPRSATIEALERSSFLVLNKHNFTIILGEIAEKRLNTMTKFLYEMAYFNTRSKSALIKLAYFFQTKKYSKSQVIFRENDCVDGVYFIKEGEVTITKRSKESRSQVSLHEPFFKIPKRISKLGSDLKIIIKGPRESFGGYELLENIEFRAYSCICSSPSVELLYLSKALLLSRVPHLDLLRDLIIDEHRRIMERYKLVCIADANQTYSTLSSSPVRIRKKELKVQRSFSKRTVNELMAKRIFPQLKRSPQSSFIRKLTEQEVHEAINGRSSVMRKYGKYSSEITSSMNLHMIIRKSRAGLIK